MRCELSVKTIVFRISPLVFGSLFLLCPTFVFNSAQAATGINKVINFQGKVVNSDGTNVTDGTYSFVFKLYDGPGSAASNTYTEDWTKSGLFSTTISSLTVTTSADGNIVYPAAASNQSTIAVGQILTDVTKGESVYVTSINTGTQTIGVSKTPSTWSTGDTITNQIYVKNGIFRASIGSLTAVSGPNFNTTNIYLGVNFNGDGEMKPRIQYTASPYAFNSDQLQGSTWAAPGAIGSTTPNSGAFTTLSSNQAASNALTLSGNNAGITFSGTGTNQIITGSGINLALMPGGNLGIGVNNPSNPLEISGTPTDAANTGVLKLYGTLTSVNNAVAGIYSNPSVSPSSSNPSNSYSALRMSAYSNSTNVGSNTTINGVYGGVYYDAASGNTLGFAKAGYFTNVANQAGATIANNYGVYIDNPTGSGTITTNYGLYVNNQTKGATNYAIYSAGGTNYFAGNAGIGVTNPQAFLSLGAATTAKASLNIASGVAPSTPNSGDLWWNGTNLYFYNGSTNKDLLAGGTGGSSAWSALTAPTTNLSLNMYQSVGTSFSTTFTYGNATSTTNLFNLTDTTSNTGTGYLLNAATATGSTVKPFHVGAAGSDALTVLANGNVGVGNNNPSSAFSVGSSSQFQLDATGDITDTAAATTGTAYTFNANSVTSGTGLAVNLNAFTGGATAYGLNVSSTSTAWTGGGALGYINWSPGSSTTATGDLLDLNVGSNGTLANIFNISNAGSSVFSVSQTSVTSNLPLNLTSPGDVAMAYDLNFTNPTASYIKSAAPLYLQSGESFNSSDLNLTTFNSGNIIANTQAFVTNGSASISGQLVLGTTAPASGGIGGLYATNASVYGKALAIFNQTESEDILTASDSGTTRFTIAKNGNITDTTAAAVNFSGAALTVASCTGCGGGGGALSGLTAATASHTIANANFDQTWNWGTLTTQTGLTLGGGTAMATGSVLQVGGMTFTHSTAETGTAQDIVFTDASTLTTGTAVSNGLAITSTVNATTGAGARQINGINISAPTLTACSAGTCAWDGIKITTPAALTNVTSMGLQVVAGGVPAADMVNITNAGQAVTTANINALSLNYIGGAAAVESAAERIDLTPGTTSGGTWSGLRVVGNTTGPVTGVIENGLKVDAPTNAFTGTFNAYYENGGGNILYGSNLVTGTNSSSPKIVLEGNGFTSSGSKNATGSFSIQTIPSTSTTAKLMFAETGFATATNVLSITQAGAVVSKGGVTTTAGTPDIAENIPVEDLSIEAGDVVSVDINATGDSDLYNTFKAMKSQTAYDPHTLGVISTSPGVILNGPADVADDAVSKPNERLLALAGRVPVKVNTDNGPIRRGDYLTASSTPGVAMKATNPGMVIGQAVGDFTGSGVGKVLVFIHVGYYTGETTQDPAAGLSGDTLARSLSQYITPTQIAGADTLLPKISANTVVAGLEITTPKLTADEIFAKHIHADSIDGLDSLETRVASLEAVLAASTSAITIPASESADLATQSAWFTTMASATALLEPTVAPLGSSSGMLDGLTVDGSATVSANLRVKGNGMVEGVLQVIDTLTTNNVVVSGLAEFFDRVVFHSDVAIQGHVTVGNDTAGFVTLRKGQKSVSLSFAKAYDTEPVVSVDLQPFDTDRQSVLAAHYSYVVTTDDTKSFTITINKPASQDLRFSWMVLGTTPEVQTASDSLRNVTASTSKEVRN